MRGMLRDLRMGTFAILVTACMLLCVLSPAIVCWNEESSSAVGVSDAEKEEFIYVSIGDSITNGYGMDGYYKDGEDMSTIAVWHLNEDSMTLVACENVWFDAVSNKVVFETTHLSYRLVGHETASDKADYMIPSIAIGLILIVGLCVALLRFKR